VEAGRVAWASTHGGWNRRPLLIISLLNSNEEKEKQVKLHGSQTTLSPTLCSIAPSLLVSGSTPVEFRIQTALCFCYLPCQFILKTFAKKKHLKKTNLSLLAASSKAPGRTERRSQRSGRLSHLDQATAAVFSTTRRTARHSGTS
jgi:hypothetical protein